MGLLDLVRRPNISRLETQQNTGALEKALSHHSWHIRRDAALALTRIRAKRADMEMFQLVWKGVTTVVALLEVWPPDPVREDAVRTLVAMGQPVVKQLCMMVEGDERKPDRLPYHHAIPYVAEALAGIGDPSAATPLAKRLKALIKHESARLAKGDATAMLGRDIVGAVGRAGFEGLLKREETLTGGSRFKLDEQALAAVTGAARDIETRNLCIALISALASLRGEAARSAIAAACSSPHDDVKRAAEVALASF